MPSPSPTSSPISIRTPKTPAKSWAPPSPPCPPSAPANAARPLRTPSSPTANSCPAPRVRNWISSLASTSCNELAGQLLAICLNGEHWPHALLDKLTTPDCSDAFFRVVVERLADLFEPRHCDTYADLFSEVLAGSMPDLRSAELLAPPHPVRWHSRFLGRSTTPET